MPGRKRVAKYSAVLMTEYGKRMGIRYAYTHKTMLVEEQSKIPVDYSFVNTAAYIHRDRNFEGKDPSL